MIDLALLQNFKTEATMLALIVVYLAFHYYGKSYNRKLATAWFKATLPVWEKNFAQVGSGNGARLQYDGPSDYVLYATGRVHCRSIYGKVELKPRHDVLATALRFIMNRTGQTEQLYDNVTINVRLNTEESSNFIFTILEKSFADENLKQRWDLDTIPTKVKNLVGFPKEYVLLTDAPEFATLVWSDPQFQQAIYAGLGLDKSGKGTALKRPWLERIVLTDMPHQKPENKEELQQAPKTLSFTFRIPTDIETNAEAQESARVLSQMAMDFVDYLGQFGKLSQETQARLVKIRENAEYQVLKIEEEKRKQQLRDKKYAEKKARSDAIVNLPPEEQRKFEEKERKKDLKKNQKTSMKKGRLIVS
ncbi:uncharacterized protein BJ171DRAFT_520205 [Polychytrium aggregatum]|uniref:uncharacterized protein n=1 Tax=Polychytrium aggregatum TaxID=110093 RepID=UPI0022FDBE34|nr:uncharacterized protein BJ171DRAFT_520205 [Polychytrium aggregatum]KAI9197408.1 hypothetical protein BJ171DRAFT_520205 [Polychytrium aggregatum]